MAIAITEVAADGHDLLNPQAQNRVATRWSGWAIAAALVAALRAEGKAVLLHCVQALSRTPCVAGLYGARLTGRTPTEALVDVWHALPQADTNSGSQAARDRLG